MLRRLSSALVLLLVSAPAIAATQGGAIPVPLPLFPANNWWNTDVSAAPLDASSAAFIMFIDNGTPRKLHPDWGGDNAPPGSTLYGFPFIIVDGSQAKRTVTFDPEAAAESDGVGTPFYPIPDEAITQYAWIEQGPPGNVAVGGDRHMLIVDKTNNLLYELYNVFYNGANWSAYSGAFFDMNTNTRRPDGWTSADAAGLAILPGLVRYDEAYGPNEIGHAFRFTVRATNNYYVYPASHVAGNNTSALPMGARLRLKASKNTLPISADPGIQKIFTAFKKYGLIVADNGSDMYISGTYDNRWDMGALNTAFNMLTADDFEVVQRGWQPPMSFILTLPAAMGAGDTATGTLTAYNSSYNVATGYTGTVHFMSTDGSATLPMDYTFTVGDAGVHTFPAGFILRTVGGQTVYATDLADATITSARNVIVGPPTPTGLVATATTGTNVNLLWNPSMGASQYEVIRASAGSAYSSLATVASTSYPDSSVTALNTYVYKVRAIDGSLRLSPFSVPDAATTMFFTDDPLVVNTTIMKAVHITELRQAVNFMRAAANLGAASFTDVSLSGVAAKAVHIDELRTALSQARSALGLPTTSFTDATLLGTVVKAAHVQELRSGVK